VAVLYFDNLSRDTADAYLADGLTEEIIIRLGQVQRLEVKSRFEVERLRGPAAPRDPTFLGRTLNAAYLVTGSVQRSGDRVRLRVALVRAATRAQIWGDVIDRSSSDMLTVESDIAGAVTSAITGQVLPAEQWRLYRSLTRDPVAYEEYLRGMRALNSQFDEPSLRSALAHFARAIARDSGMAEAYAGEAGAWESLADFFVTPLEGYRRAREASDRALQLDSTSVMALATRGLAVLALDFDARGAERLARRGLMNDPRENWAHGVLSMALLAEGKIDSSLAEARRTWEADSLSDSNWFGSLLVTFRPDSAAIWLPRLRRVMRSADADYLDGQLMAVRGDWRGAERLLGWRESGGVHAGTYVRALLARSDTVAVRATIDSMLAARTPGYYNPLSLARAYAALGDLDHGMEWLRRAFEEHTVGVVWVRSDVEMAPLRADPRYADLDRQLQF